MKILEQAITLRRDAVRAGKNLNEMAWSFSDEGLCKMYHEAIATIPYASTGKEQRFMGLPFSVKHGQDADIVLS